jgi:hypothetical protein
MQKTLVPVAFVLMIGAAHADADARWSTSAQKSSMRDRGPAIADTIRRRKTLITLVW